MKTPDESLFEDCSFWYRQPAERWEDGLPLANGRMGAMLFGGARAERISLSETTFWSGEPSQENNPPNGPETFRAVRELLLNGNIAEANRLAVQLEGRKLNYGTNLPFGDLRLYFDHEELQARDYRRELDLDSAIATVTYQVNGVNFKRELFVSAPAQVLVLRLSASHPSCLSFRVALDGAEQPYRTVSEADETQVMTVHAFERQHSDGRCGVEGHARLRILSHGGQTRALDGQLMVEAADDVVLLLAMGTTYDGSDPFTACSQQVAAAEDWGFEALRADHIREQRGWFRRAGLELGTTEQMNLPLDERIDAVRKGADDPGLCALLFQFGRYLLLGSSRPDSPLPAHLNGVWNDNKACRIGWTCDYHLDINTQMNYWIAEIGGLGECVQPLFRWMDATLVPSGRKTAEKLYGLPGWVAHIFSNAWGYSAWGWSIDWGVFPTGGVWTAMHLWDHYQFGGDRDFLACQAYPVLKEAAEFCLAYLVRDPRTGWLVSGPANSPENPFLVHGERYAVSMGPTIDRVLIGELLGAVIEASQILGQDADLCAQLESARSQLPPYQIGRHGQVQEWLEDFDEAVPGHRHTSHLLGLFPFDQISPRATPELAQAVRVSIERRVKAEGYEEGAWARNNLTLFFARLSDAPAAYQSLMSLFRQEAGTSLLTGTRLAPAQAYEMDYNTGASAGIAEMLLQSQSGVIELLPALPSSWSEGRFAGLRGRGGFEVSLAWRDGKPFEVRIVSHLGLTCRVRGTEGLRPTWDGAELRPLPTGEVEFETQSGKEYILRLVV